MASKLDQIVADMGLASTIKKNIQQERSTGVTDSELNRSAGDYFSEKKNTAERESAILSALRSARARPKAVQFQKLEMQKQREDRQWEGVSLPGADKIRKDTAAKVKSPLQLQQEKAQKEYDSYIGSDDYRRRVLDGLAEGSRSAADEDQQEKELRIKRDYWNQQIKRQDEQKRQESDLKVIEAMTSEEKEALEEYIRSRESAFAQSLNPAMTGLPASYEDNPLIQKYGRTRLDQLVRSYQRSRNREEYEDAQQLGAAQGKAAAVGASAASVGANLADTFLNPLERISQMWTGADDRFETLDPYAGGKAGAYASGVRQQVAQDIEGEDPTLLRKALSYLYQGGMSALDSGTRALIGGSPTVAAGLSALGSFNQTLSSASAQGATPEQAVALAAVNAGIEALAEKLPMDELFKIAGGRAGRHAIVNILKQAGFEAAEEEVSLILTTLAEAAILKEKSGYQQTIQEAMAVGATYEEAKTIADQELLQEAGETAIVSSFAGGLSAVGAERIAPKFGKPDQSRQMATGSQERKQEVRRQEEAAQPVQKPQEPDRTAWQETDRRTQETRQETRQEPQKPAEQRTAQQEPAKQNDQDEIPEFSQEDLSSISGEPRQEADPITATAQEYAAMVPKQEPEAIPEGLRHFDNAAAEAAGVRQDVRQETEKTPEPEQAQDRRGPGSDREVGKMGFKYNFVLPDNSYFLPGSNGSYTLYDDGTVASDAIYDVQNNLEAWKNKGIFHMYDVTVDGKPVAQTDDFPPGFYMVAGVDKRPVLRELAGSYLVAEKGRIVMSKDGKMPKKSGNAQKTQESQTQQQTAPKAHETVSAPAVEVNPMQQQIMDNTVRKLGFEPEYVDNKDTEDTSAGENLGSQDAVGKIRFRYNYINPPMSHFEEGKGGHTINDFIIYADNTVEADINSDMFYELESVRQYGLFNNYDLVIDGKVIDTTSNDRLPSGFYAVAGYEKRPVLQNMGNGSYMLKEKGRIVMSKDGKMPKKSGNAQKTQESQTQQQTAPKAQETVSAPMVDTQKVSPEEGQIKGTGAAEAEFSGKPNYYATLSADNAQPDRKTDVRPMELPQQDVNGGNISAVTGNVYGSENTPQELAEAMEEPTASGDFSYIRLSNDRATERAREQIGKAGSWEDAERTFHDEVMKGKTGAELSARAAMILNHMGEEYQRLRDAGDAEGAAKAKRDWLRVLSDVRKLGTNTAQGLQALKIIRSLQPQDKIDFMSITVDEMGKKLGLDLTIDQELLTEYEQATTDEARNEVIGKIQKQVAQQIPATFMDKWNALRYTNMLGNLKTQIRNIGGNFVNSAVYRAKDSVGAVLEAAAGDKVEKTKSLTVSKPLLDACMADFEQVAPAVESGRKYGDSLSASNELEQGIMDERRIFKSGFMEGYRKLTSEAMEVGDAWFGKRAYARALAGYLKANGITGGDLSRVSPELMDKARTYAVKQAQEVTFHDNTVLAKKLGEIQKATGFVGEALIPFTKTPANVLTRAVEFSPLGIVDSTVKSIQAATGKADVTGADVIDSWAKSLTGSGIFALGAYLMSQGVLSIGPDEDKKKAAYDKLNGVQNYAMKLKVGGQEYSFTLDWMTPAAMPLFMGAQFIDLIQNRDGELTFADLEKVWTSIADPMIQMSMMQGISDALSNVQDADENFGQFLINAAVSYLSQGLTNTLLGQIEKSTEKTRQTTYIDKDSWMPRWMQQQLGKASQKIPGVDFQQTDYIDAWGQTQEQDTGPMGWVYNLLSPGYLSKTDIDAMDQELYRLREQTGENVFPQMPDATVTWTDKAGTVHSKENLNQQQADTLKRETGQTAARIVKDLIQSEEYAALTDQQKAKAISEVYSYAKQTGQIKAIGESHSGYSESWMRGLAQGDEAAAILGRIADNTISGAFSSLTDDLKNGYNATDSRKGLEEAYNVYNAMSDSAKERIRGNATGREKGMIAAREAGVTGEAFANLYEQYYTISQSDKDTSTKAQQWRTELEKAVETGTITAKQREVMREHFGFRYSMPAETEKFDQLTESGISADKADWMIKALQGVKGTGSIDQDTGKKTVRNVDKWEAIAGASGMTPEEIDMVMLAYMPDYEPGKDGADTTEIKYQYARQELGISPAAYMKAYRAYSDREKGENGAEAIAETGLDSQTAQALANMFGGKKYYMNMVKKWYSEQ